MLSNYTFKYFWVFFRFFSDLSKLATHCGYISIWSVDVLLRLKSIHQAKYQFNWRERASSHSYADKRQTDNMNASILETYQVPTIGKKEEPYMFQNIVNARRTCRAYRVFRYTTNICTVSPAMTCVEWVLSWNHCGCRRKIKTKDFSPVQAVTTFHQ